MAVRPDSPMPVRPFHEHTQTRRIGTSAGNLSQALLLCQSTTEFVPHGIDQEQRGTDRIPEFGLLPMAVASAACVVPRSSTEPVTPQDHPDRATRQRPTHVPRSTHLGAGSGL